MVSADVVGSTVIAASIQAVKRVKRSRSSSTRSVRSRISPAVTV